MSLYIALSMLVVFIGTAVSCLRIPGLAADLDADAGRIWAYVAGLATAIVSALCQSGRLASQELLFAAHRRVTPLQIATVTGLLAAAFLRAVLATAQALPGPDHGVQVNPPPGPPSPPQL
jgi:hypothetical protein